MNSINRTELALAGLSAVLFSDQLPASGPLPANIVVGPGGASQTLLQLTPRRFVNRVWDIGCGCGVQAVFAAQHSNQVIATDIDPRCLEFTQQSAAATGVKVETRLGSLVEPVTDQQFDLIVANPPFVIGDVTDLVHRQSPFPADHLTNQLLAEIPKYLADEGLAVLLSSWLDTVGSDWQERIADWLPVDCDVWVGLRDSLAPNEYVQFWLSDAGRETDTELAKRWQSQLANWQTNAVCFGWIVLSKTDATPVHQIEDLRNAIRVPNGEEVLVRLAAMRAADQLTSTEILTRKFEQVTTQNWRGDVALDGVLLAIRERCNAKLTVTEVVNEVAASLQLEVDDVLIHALVGVKELVNLGLLA